MRILLGVSGSIACYKALELTRLLKTAGHDVRVVMSRSAMEFVKPLSFAALSGSPVSTTFWEEGAAGAIGHIELADWADVYCIAPASAQTIAGLAHGFADEPLLAVALATKAPLVLAPAMNVNMYEADAVQRNLSALQSRQGVRIVAPDCGELACGWVGQGRLAELSRIIAACEEVCASHLSKDHPVNGHPLRGRHIVISAGGTREPIDAVRFISNRSSGRMGVALAAEAQMMGARVTLVHGAISVPLPAGVASVAVETADEMHAALREVVAKDTPDYFFMSAAVADFKVAHPQARKLKKDEVSESLPLERNVDILLEISRINKGQRRFVLIGFCVETGDEALLFQEAKRKLRAKNCDLMVANFANEAIGTERSRLFVFDIATEEPTLIGPAAKSELARELLMFCTSRLSSTGLVSTECLSTECLSADAPRQVDEHVELDDAV